jgi:predicted nucleic acid-binding protein
MDYVVVDSSVAIKWLVVEPYSAEAHRILDGYRTGALTLLAPDLINAEMGNIVWKKHLFQGMGAADAQMIIDVFRTLPLTLTPTATLLEDAYRLAVTHQRSVYDAMYLALSLREKCRLVTANEKLVNAIGKVFPNLVWVVNWP